ncbi:MAG: GNAT family N-acetyltransferase [Pseudonocardia sp.]|nr:GNAT family N-acetyltransferase [Pseudonocardia sp.]
MIRPAGPADVPALAELRWEFRAGAAIPVEGRAEFLARFRRWVGRALVDDRWRAWVAELPDATIVGHVFAATIDKLPNPVDEAETHRYVSNLYVRPEHRGRGLGSALLAAALDGADAADDTVVLWARPGTGGFYAGQGFGPSPEILERRPMHTQRPAPAGGRSEPASTR